MSPNHWGRWLRVCALLAMFVCVAWGRNKITLVYSSDMSESVEELPISQMCHPDEKEEKKCVGGWCRIITKVKQIRRTDNDSLVLTLDLGNNVYKSVEYLIFGPSITQRFLRLLKPDVMTVNQRELYLSAKEHADHIRAVGAPCVLTNAEIASDSPLSSLVNKSAVVEHAGVRVGVMAFISSNMHASVRKDITMGEPIDALNTECRKLRTLNLALVVVVAICPASYITTIAERVICVNVILSGDPYYFLYSGKKPLFSPIGKYPVIVTRKDDELVLVGGSCVLTYYICYMSLEMNEMKSVVSWSGRPILLDASVAKDMEMKSILRSTTMTKVLETFSSTYQVGVTRALIDGRSCMHEECSLGNLMADAIIAYGWQSKITDSLMSLVSGAELCRTIDGNRENFGRITKGNLLTCLVYNCKLHTAYISGREFTAIMEYALGLVDHITGQNIAFLQVSGLRVNYDPTRSQRTKVIYLEGRVMGEDGVPCYQLLDPSKIYKVIVTDNLIQLIRSGTLRVNQSPRVDSWNVTQLTALTWYINHTSPIYPAVEGRIIQETLYNSADPQLPTVVPPLLLLLLLLLPLLVRTAVTN